MLMQVDGNCQLDKSSLIKSNDHNLIITNGTIYILSVPGTYKPYTLHQEAKINMDSYNNNQLYGGNSSAVAYCSDINSSSYARAVSTLSNDDGSSAIAMNNSSAYTSTEQRDDTTSEYAKQTNDIDMMSRDQPPPPQVAGIVATVSNEEVNEFMQYLSHKNNIDNCNSTEVKAAAEVNKATVVKKKKSGPKKKKSVSKKAHTCKHVGCTNNVVNSGVCYRHGAKKRLCKHEGCTNMIKR